MQVDIIPQDERDEAAPKPQVLPAPAANPGKHRLEQVCCLVTRAEACCAGSVSWPAQPVFSQPGPSGLPDPQSMQVCQPAVRLLCEQGLALTL